MPEKDYQPEVFEPRWARAWEAEWPFRAAAGAGRKPYYVLEMLPYPSGALHLGHIRNYSIGDAVARFLWMRGREVLHPMGWDAFGLPAENAAQQHHTHPRAWTLANIARMKRQFLRFGFSYDWSREIATCLPEYYRWNQWFFLRFLQKGVAYRKKGLVNWCPKCATVLANEQVAGGVCWRHEDTPVEQRELEQWYFRISDYAEELLRDLDQLSEWPERVRVMQRNWIGRSEGAEVDFAVLGEGGERGETPAAETEGEALRVFTTRLDTIYGASALLLAPEHPWVAANAAPEQRAAAARLSAARRFGALDAEPEKEGFFTGRYARNPFSGERLPIWVANFVLMGYGAGAVMAVPAHDERDFEFCSKYGLPIRQVIVTAPPGEPAPALPPPPRAMSDDGWLVASGEFSGLANRGSGGALERMTQFAQDHGFGRATITYRLRDWGVSRQRYWGTPIPVVYCAGCGMQPVPESELPVLLPEDVDITGAGESPLARHAEFLRARCPKCGGEARRETDTMDTFMDSSWYFYRYLAPHHDAAALDGSEVARWMPVDQYVGGIEHAILHLIYMRFFTKVMRDLGLVKFGEPVKRLFNQGMITRDGAKMSKSRGNVVDPEEMIAKHGADATRMYVLFAAPPEKDFDWSDRGVEGIHRFLARAYRLVVRRAAWVRGASEGRAAATADAAADPLTRKTQQTLAKITRDFEGRWHFNTSVAALMELVNEFYLREAAVEAGEIPAAAAGRCLDLLVRMLAPFAPFLAEELWRHELGRAEPVALSAWPEADPELAREEDTEVPVQINGKLRAKITIPSGLAGAERDAELRRRALAEGKIVAALGGQAPRKVIVARGELVNIVV